MRDLDIELATSDEYGVHFETGIPVTFRFLRNTEKSPNFGAKYGQDIEPAGRYMLHNPDPGRLSRGWEAGEITFHKPLVIPLTGDRNAIYGPEGWKASLHGATGKKGVELTRHLRELGYDGIVTVDSDGYTREIVDMTRAPLAKNPPKKFKSPYDDEPTSEAGNVLSWWDYQGHNAFKGYRGSGKTMPIIAIITGEMSDPAYKYRVTFFAPDGPLGHAARKYQGEIASEIARSMHDIEPISQDEVIDWTSTEEFINGSKMVALVQADNALRYRAHQAGRGKWGQEISWKASDLSRTDVDAAIRLLTDALDELPQKNPPRAGFVMNPPWVTKALADSFEVLNEKVPARWLPQLASVTRSGKSIVADLIEYGCGSYGCVLATLDPRTVLKVTSDETESEFAARIANNLVAPICVDYRMVVRLSQRHEGRTIHLLWRESAENVGEIDHVLDRGHTVAVAIDKQHRAAQQAFAVFMQTSSSLKFANAALRYVDDWLEAVRDMGGKVPELEDLADGLLKVWERQKILFGDIHAGNLGLVTRNGEKKWVITDPGNIAVIGA